MAFFRFAPLSILPLAEFAMFWKFDIRGKILSSDMLGRFYVQANFAA